tara:strand:+ start:755 stop:1012 length:258 start_codon:yes stop_codon:yes gene_type:complete
LGNHRGRGDGQQVVRAAPGTVLDQAIIPGTQLSQRNKIVIMLEPDNVNTMPVAKQYLYYINHDVDRYKKELKLTVKTNKNSKKKK